VKAFIALLFFVFPNENYFVCYSKLLRTCGFAHGGLAAAFRFVGEYVQTAFLAEEGETTATLPML